jgi:hypothetical protein
MGLKIVKCSLCERWGKQRNCPICYGAGQVEVYENEDTGWKYFKWGCAGFFGLTILLVCTQSPYDQTAHDNAVLNSAEQKMDEGLPLNKEESNSVDSLFPDPDKEREKQIEKQNGE